MDTCDSSNFMDAPESLSICEFKDPTQRNLLDDFETPLKAVKNKHHMNVYLRVRPFTQHELETSENKVGFSSLLASLNWFCISK